MSRLSTPGVGLILMSLLASGPTTIAADAISLPLRFVVEVGPNARADTPVSVSLDGLADPLSPMRLVERTNGASTPTPAQLEPGSPPRLWWIVRGVMPVGGRRVYELRAGQPAVTSPIEVRTTEAALEIRRGDAKILRYNRAHVPPPAGADPLYGRSAHIHPVWTPSGRVVTEQFPADHMHQDGIWFALVRTEFEGRHPDFWNLPGKTGRVRFGRLHNTTSGPVYGGFRVENEHVDLSGPTEKVALRETWDVRAWNVGGSAEGYWVFDVTSTLRCATASPVTVLKYHYGGLAMRGASGWYDERCRFLTSDGKTRADGNHTRVRWCDMAGTSGDTWFGLAILSHPKNTHFPEPIRIHPTMPYMCYAPSHVGPWSIEPGREHVSRYRFIVHDGSLEVETANRIWRSFAEPLTVKVEEGS